MPVVRWSYTSQQKGAARRDGRCRGTRPHGCGCCAGCAVGTRARLSRRTLALVQPLTILVLHNDPWLHHVARPPMLLYGCFGKDVLARMFLYGCVCTDVFVRMFLYGCVCMDVFVWMFLYGCVCTDVFVWMCLYGCFCTDVFVRMFLYGCFCMDVFVWMSLV